MVPDPFDVVRCLQRHEHKAQIGRDRLPEREKLKHPLVEFEFEGVQPVVRPPHARRHQRVALGQALHGRAHQLLRPAGHLQEHLLETVQLGVEGASGTMRFRHGVRPVRYDSVRASRGFVNTVSVGPYSSSSPRSRNPVRSDSRAACQRLRVAITIE